MARARAGRPPPSRCRRRPAGLVAGPSRARARTGRTVRDQVRPTASGDEVVSRSGIRGSLLPVSVQGGSVDELLDATVERPLLQQLEVEVGTTAEDRIQP